MNQARKPQGGDTDQIRAVGAGECGVALTNSYYLIRLMRSIIPRDIETIKNVGFLFPNQKGSGTHVNVTGAGILKNAPNPKNANLFLTFLTEADTQKMFAYGNNEWPAVKGLKTENQILDDLGDFKKDELNIEAIGSKQFTAQKIADQVGWQETITNPFLNFVLKNFLVFLAGANELKWVHDQLLQILLT